MRILDARVAIVSQHHVLCPPVVNISAKKCELDDCLSFEKITTYLKVPGQKSLIWSRSISRMER